MRTPWCCRNVAAVQCPRQQRHNTLWDIATVRTCHRPLDHAVRYKLQLFLEPGARALEGPWASLSLDNNRPTYWKTGNKVCRRYNCCYICDRNEWNNDTLAQCTHDFPRHKSSAWEHKKNIRTLGGWTSHLTPCTGGRGLKVLYQTS